MITSQSRDHRDAYSIEMVNYIFFLCFVLISSVAYTIPGHVSKPLKNHHDSLVPLTRQCLPVPYCTVSDFRNSDYIPKD